MAAKSSGKRTASAPPPTPASTSKRFAALAMLASAAGVSAFAFRSEPPANVEQPVQSVSTPRIAAQQTAAATPDSLVPDSAMALPRRVPFAGVTASSDWPDEPQPRLLPSTRETTPPSIPDRYEPLVVPSREAPRFLEQDEIPPSIAPEQMREIVQQGRWPMEAAPIQSSRDSVAPTAQLQRIEPEVPVARAGENETSSEANASGWTSRSYSATQVSLPPETAPPTFPTSPSITNNSVTPEVAPRVASTPTPTNQVLTNQTPIAQSPTPQAPAVQSPAPTNNAAVLLPPTTGRGIPSSNAAAPQPAQGAAMPPASPSGLFSAASPSITSSPSITPPPPSTPSPSNTNSPNANPSAPGVGSLLPTPDPVSTPFVPQSTSPTPAIAAGTNWSGINGAPPVAPYVPESGRAAVAPGFGGQGATAAPPRQASQPLAWRVYKVRDGDTLESIATSLLGDAGRARDLYEANRDSIGPGGALPLGVVLVVPPAR